MGDIDAERLQVRSLLSLSAPGDALYAYYAFYHDRDRTELHVHEDKEGTADGFLAVCQTGQRLFQPTVVLRTPNVDVAVELLREALEPGRPYYLVTTPDLKEAVSPVVAMSEPHTSRVYEIDLSRFEYEVNVLVVAEEGIEGRPRFLVRSEDEVVAEAGLGWKSPHFAGVNVQATEAAQRRGLDRAVLSACTRWVVRSGLHPLVIADVKDGSTTRLVERVGYVDSGARVLAGDVTCCR
jgi:hypothetical protein